MQHTPSVLVQPLEQASPVDVDGFGSSPPGGSNSPSRRQRISMACQYCRHRKIRCCGGSPCRNCARSQRECEYAPVPEEVNRATRNKKAVAKASKSIPHHSMTTFPPYMTDTPVFKGPFVSAHRAQFGHRRSVSTPNFEISAWVNPPAAPTMQSPAMFEPAQWMYNSWSSAPVPVSRYPSVLEPAFTVESGMPPTPSDSHSGSTEPEHSFPQMPTSWSTPSIPTQGYLHPPVPLTPLTVKGHLREVPSPISSPNTPSSAYYEPFPTPPLYQHTPLMYSPSPLNHAGQTTSPTLTPEMAAMQKDLVGLGIGVPPSGYVGFHHTPQSHHEEYFQPIQY
ncbi:hypothetical protein BCR39DRAFT_553066 [Naematelia encephala]|uniref:Zn(2)-C6 fungal-type domain-containing protein n=1 Tax=Naematelia encephala TaxID=71784 RepID=A0A1Y2AHT9_9TREE|nr:hypothetical protein BCR39DRAFT_553066 [Naematelia encephala]